MLVFGGNDGFARIQTWALSLGSEPQWTNLHPGGTPPDRSPYSPTAIYDPVRDRMVVYLGDSHECNVWALSLGPSPEWSRLFFLGPSPGARLDATAIYDPAGDRMIVFGGFGTGSPFGDLNEVWEFSLGGDLTWTKLQPAGTAPPKRSSHTAIYDPVEGRMIIFGGYFDAWETGLYWDVWALRLGASPEWISLGGLAETHRRRDHSAIYDSVRGRMVVFGGKQSECLADVWAMGCAGSPGWTNLTPYANLPRGRFSHTAIYDPAGDRILVNNGRDQAFLVGSAVLALSLGADPEWTELGTTGPAPRERSSHTAIHDPARERMVVFGGIGWGDMWTPAERFNDTWELTLAAAPQWSQLTPSGSPPAARAGHTAIYDPVGDRMIVFGGSLLNDTWELSLGEAPAWSQLVPSGSLPAARYAHTAVYDPVGCRMIVFGGYASSNLNDVWALSLGEAPVWSQLAPSGSLPAARRHHTAIYDRIGKRMVVFGGDGGGYLNDTWALTLGAEPQWIQLAPTGAAPQKRLGQAATYDPVRDRMVVYGGYTYVDSEYLCLPNPWVLTWGRVGCATPEIASYDPHVVNDQNCPEGCTITFTVDTEDDHATVAKVLLERRVASTWVPEDSIVAPSSPPPWSLGCVFDEHFGDGDHVFRAAFYCMDGSSTVSQDVTVVANRGVPVLFAGFDADLLDGGVLLRWRVVEGVGLRGFNVYRSLQSDAGFVRVNGKLVPADGGSEYADRTVNPGATYWYRLGAVADDGEWMSQTISVEVPRAELALRQNVPNPFNPTTTISFVLPERTRAVLAIYDVEGRRVRTLVDEVLGGGLNEAVWDARDTRGRRVSSGVYLYRLQAGNRTITKKLTVLK